MPHLLYLIGQPGSGKSTVCDWMTESLEFEQLDQPFAHRVWQGTPRVPVVELGARRERFSGTDALSMSVQPKVVDYLAAEKPELVLAEGDRLANSKFFTAVLGLGYQLWLVRLLVSAAVAERRRYDRVLALGGKPQNTSWVQGRVTKNRRLAEEWDPLEIDADRPVIAVLHDLRALGCPVTDALTSQP
jgi:hypothetical protein